MALLILGSILFAPLNSGAAADACDAAFDATSTKSLTAAARPKELPEGFRLYVWRYNSGIKDHDGKSSFDNAHVNMLEFNQHSKAYHTVQSESVANNELVQSPESRRQTYDGGMRLVISDPVKQLLTSQAKGEGVFERNQSFTLDLYEKHAYLSPEETALQLSIAKNFLKPEQVTFIEATTPTTERALKKEYGKIPPDARLEPKSAAWDQYQSYYAGYKKPRNRPYELKVGGAWLISGQVDGKNVPLALEAEGLVRPIDRSRYKYVFEIGRAGQKTNFEFEETLRALLFHAMSDVLASGGRIEDAYVFAHAMDRARAITFRRRYGGEEFSRYQDPKRSEESVLVGSLADLLAKLDPADFSSELKALRTEAPSSARVSSPELYKTLIQNQKLANQKLKLSFKDGPSGEVEIRDFSYLRHAILDRAQSMKKLTESEKPMAIGILAGSPLLQNRDNIAVALESQRHTPDARMTRLEGIPRVHPLYQTESLQNLNEFLSQQRAIEIFPTVTSGRLTREQAESLVVATYDRYVGYLKKRNVADPEAFMKDYGIHFALTLNNASFRNLGEGAVSPEYWYVYRSSVTLVENFGGYGLGFGGYRRTVPQVFWQSWSLSVDQILALKKSREPLGVRIQSSRDLDNEFLKEARHLRP